ncbi:exopolyphosphatase [Desnuesiella massiliensis]|uniref:Ppx/GppA phosphatase family protein n=1 Tax=Desnuesiella massiliensis TaxID=1650662 RepID=UPI0006E31430|nr:exopolyphosphatase [Desnuesiella massiliensis]
MGPTNMETMAAIDLGSNAIRLIIAQIMPNGEYFILEELEKPTDVGKDTFTLGKIRVETIQNTCETLKGFSKLMKEYRVKNYRAVSTSGIREAENKHYILDQVRLKTGIEVKDINNAEERFYIHKALDEHLTNGREIIFNKSAMIINVGSGGVEASVYSEGNLKFTRYVKVGALRLYEFLSQMKPKTLDFPDIISEYVDSKIYVLKDNIEKLNIKNYIGLGGDLSIISSMCIKNKYNKNPNFIPKDALLKLYDKIKNMNVEILSLEYSIPLVKAELILPSLIIFIKFLNMTKAEGIFAPRASLKHGVLVDMIDEKLNTPRKKEFLNDILSSVRYIASKYGVDENHAKVVENLAITLFDSTVPIHKLGEREKLYLQISAILHDVGKYINLNNHEDYCFNIIKSEDIMGLSDRELLVVANIAKYYGNRIPSSNDKKYNALNSNERIIVSKLAAILKLSEALDVSRRNKISKIIISMEEHRSIFINVYVKNDILLEEWSFSSKSEFFEEVMGCKAILKIHRDF